LRHRKQPGGRKDQRFGGNVAETTALQDASLCTMSMRNICNAALVAVVDNN
jgi:hypothetical protein